jgi:hypothetical protein
MKIHKHETIKAYIILLINKKEPLKVLVNKYIRK